MQTTWQPKLLGERVDFEVVVHSWLKDELHESPFDKMKGRIPERLIITPDFENPEENKARYDLLSLRRSPIISPLPSDTVWYKFQIDENDLQRIFHCMSPDWGKITNGTFQVFEAVKNVNIQDDHAKKVRDMLPSFNEDILVNGLILVCSSPESLFTIIEGNHRFVSAVSVKKSRGIISEISYLGVSQKMKGYIWHVENHLRVL